MSQPADSHASFFRPALIEQCMLGAIALAVVAMLSFPAARGVSDSFGWLPFWLLALPACAWATARVLRLRASPAPARQPARVHVLASARPRMPARPMRALPQAA